MADPLRQFLRLLEPGERRALAVLLAGVMLQAVLEMAGVALLPLFIAALARPEEASAQLARLLHAPALMSIDPRRWLVGLAAGTGFFFVAKNGLALVLLHAQAVCKCRLMGRLGRRLLAGYLHAPYAWHLVHGSAAIQHNLQHEVVGLFQRLVNPVLIILSEGAVILFIVALLLAVAPVATLAMLLLIALMLVLYLRVVRGRLQRLGRALVERRRAIYVCLQNSLGGIKELQVLGRLAYFERQFGGLVDGVARAEEFNSAVGLAAKPGMETVAVAALCGLAGWLALRPDGTAELLPGLALFAVAAVRVMPSANRIFIGQVNLRYGLPGALAVLDDLESTALQARAAVVEKDHPPVRLELAREMRLRGVSYRYPGAERESLSAIDLAIPRGAAVAFVGASGAGKTTLADVILGLLPPTRGSVEVDGIEISTALQSWQRQIGYIPQMIHLADDTLRANVAFGLGEGEIDDARVWAALEMAQLAGLVHTWPERLDRLVGERGVRLSGGQRQRIGIARALYHDPAVLVLDEATAALDHETEREIVEVLERLHGRQTLIIIAHRLSTVRRCDTLFHLGGGRLLAHGTFAELERDCPGFSRMVRAGGLPGLNRDPRWDGEYRAAATSQVRTAPA